MIMVNWGVLVILCTSTNLNNIFNLVKFGKYVLYFGMSGIYFIDMLLRIKST